MYKAITYIGKIPNYRVRVKNKSYEFEWQKSVGIGSRSDEINVEDAIKISKKKDRNNRKLFRLE